jgi:maltooligosyltrehalose trehalohydrolase
VTAAQFRAASLLLCLSPFSPMLFMGQEWAASSPFLFFTDHEGEKGRSISEARRREFAQTGLNRTTLGDFPDPQDPDTFLKSKLIWSERDEPIHGNVLALYREALKLRRKITEAGATRRENWRAESVGDVLVLRYQFDATCWLLLTALRPAHLSAGPEIPVLAPPVGESWDLKLSSEDVRFGGDAAKAVFVHSFTGPASALFVARKEASDAAV